MNGSNMDGTDESKKPDFDRKPPRKRPTKRCIFIIAAVVILCIVISIVLAVQLRPKSKDDCPKGIHCDWRSVPHSEFLTDQRCDSLCTTRPCIRSAQYALSRIDSSKDPCEDFYAFACGTYEEEALIFPEESEGVYTFQEMGNEVLLNLKEIIDSIDENSGMSSFALRITKGLYNDCMETDHHAAVLNKELWKQLFAENGRLPWPLLNQNTRNDQKHFVRMMASTLFLGVNPFFKLQNCEAQVVNKKHFLVLRFVKSEDIDLLQRIHKDWNLEDGESLASRYAFAFRKILTELGVGLDDLSSILANIMELEKHFVELTTKAIESNKKVYENNYHLSNEYHNHSCQDLDHNMGNIKWCEVIKQLRKEYGFPADIPIRIELPSLGDYFTAVNTVLGHYLDRDVINYIGVQFMLSFMKYMPSPLREIYYQDKDLFPGRRTYLPLTSRWQQCVEVVSEFMGMPLEKEYLKEKLDDKARDQVHHMVKNIKETYLSLLDKMSLMKSLLKGAEPKKLVRNMKLVIGRADQILNMNEEHLDKLYSLGYADSGGKFARRSLLESVLQMIEFDEKIPVLVEVADFIMSIRSNSRFFSIFPERIPLDEIYLSYGGLAFPMYLLGRPMYLEYSNLGTAISMYMIHLLSIHMDLDNTTVRQFRDAANCLWEQSHLYNTETTNFEVKNLRKRADPPTSQSNVWYFENLSPDADDLRAEKRFPVKLWAGRSFFSNDVVKTLPGKFSGDSLDDISRRVSMMTHTMSLHVGYLIKLNGDLPTTEKLNPSVQFDHEAERTQTFRMGSWSIMSSYLDHLEKNGDDKGLPGLPFTNEQLFFISAAQAHCEKLTEKGHKNLPPHLAFSGRSRVNVPLANLKEFSEAFRCPSDSSMNLKRRCCLLGDGKLSRDCK